MNKGIKRISAPPDILIGKLKSGRCKNIKRGIPKNTKARHYLWII